MIVVADTSPINYLILIEAIGVVPALYRRALIPQAVYDELLQHSAPDVVRAWMRNRPSWMEIRNPTLAATAASGDVDAAELDAILLAEELGADRLIIDDQEGRREAERRGLAVSGTLGVLRDAAGLGLLDLRDAISRLQATNFHIAPEVLTKLLSDLP